MDERSTIENFLMDPDVKVFRKIDRGRHEADEIQTGSKGSQI